MTAHKGSGYSVQTHIELRPTKSTSLATIETFEPLSQSECTQSGGAVTLLPLLMRVPNKYGIYSPHPYREKFTLSYAEFVRRYADNPRTLLVCFEPEPQAQTIHQQAESVTAYGDDADCWYIISG